MSQVPSPIQPKNSEAKYKRVLKNKIQLVSKAYLEVTL